MNGIKNDSALKSAFFIESDGNRKHGKLTNIVGGAVQGVHHPDRGPVPGRQPLERRHDGRAGVAVIELDSASPAHTAALHGVSTPPFDVP